MGNILLYIFMVLATLAVGVPFLVAIMYWLVVQPVRYFGLVTHIYNINGLIDDFKWAVPVYCFLMSSLIIFFIYGAIITTINSQW